MKRILVLSLLLGVCSLWVFAQADAPEDADNAEDAADAADAEAPVEKEYVGDVITFKTGAVLDDVQVIGRTPMAYEVLIVKGVTLSISRKQVTNIEYDDIEPSRGAAKGAGDEAESNVFVGEKLKPEVETLLMSEIPGLPMKLETKDVVSILAEMSTRVGVPIEVDDAVKALPKEQRVWHFEDKSGRTLLMVLQDDLGKTFKNLRVTYKYDRIAVTLREQPGAEAGVAPAEQEGKPEGGSSGG